MDALPLTGDWLERLGHEVHKPYWEKLQIFLRGERSAHEVFPPEDQVFAALHLTSYADTRIVILGQDPYHGPGQAHGLSFSVPADYGKPKPPSLVNIRKELASDCGVELPAHGSLEGWSRQGVLLLNTTLTVREGEANSHQGQGWEQFTNEVIRVLNEKSDRVVFLLWGSEARKRKKLIDGPQHAVVEAGHPKAWASAHLPFLNSHPFTQANQLLVEAGRTPVDWGSL
jgi:uracil-DNA glycosylase